SAGEVTEQYTLAIADEFGLDVLVGRGVLHYRADVHAALMRECALADEWLIRAQREVGAVGDVACDVGELTQTFTTDSLVTHLQFEVGDDGDEIGIAASLTVAVDGALYVRSARFDSSEGVSHSDIGIIVRMDSDGSAEALHDLRDDD